MRLPKWTFMVAAMTSVSVWTAACSSPDQPAGSSSAAIADVAAVSPALDDYRDRVIEGELWQRPGLSPRDRSVVTVAALIARNQSIDMAAQFERALDNGVTAAELSEIITHLAFYAGWPNALSAVATANDVFTHRAIDTDDLPSADEPLLPLNQAVEDQRRTTNEQNYGAVAPGVLQYTTDVLFTDLWLRPGLAPRDRSLITVSALVASGQTGQITFHLGRAMDSGLTQDEASETLTQLAFYSGWPTVFSALPVFKDVFATRPR
ncbi:carboxymuconolactone decarboxylase family protein [Mycobacterium sp. ITM-2016-00318]|uniref:carboxymuconolactone decarboxylase family protein n=1 Tax=Mycobacterium sp. ITM-2016-00318 TaxID=2099693 RepID=UPI001E3149F1|nr:carboxymuconolactone decarboxylase family protein [Mycobacterium sp. ITM-2016-00318]WNG94481.1 carboxymuconolactone decarboxylase family protein [Mycobacterium sp. ITM-2016-00318]